MSDFTKIIRLGTVEAWRGRRVSVFCKITLRDGRLSITGVEGPAPNGDAVSCGQIDMHLRDKPASEWKLAPGWNADLLARFFATWKRWHLNDLKAGSAAQEAWLRENPVNAIYPESHYEKTCEALAAAGLNPDADGYKYGTAWQREDIPDDVTAWLQALPATDRQPAWV